MLQSFRKNGKVYFIVDEGSYELDYIEQAASKIRMRQKEDPKTVRRTAFKGKQIYIKFEKDKIMFEDLKEDEAAMFVYFATWQNKDGLIAFDTGAAMSKADMREMSLFTKDKFYRCFNRLLELGYIKENKADHFRISDAYCTTSSPAPSKTVNYIRIGVEAYKHIYNNQTDIKGLGYVLKLLPFMRFETLQLCKNPREIDPALREPLSIQEIAELVGFDVANKSKLKKLLCEKSNCINDNEHLVVYEPSSVMVNGKKAKYFRINNLMFGC